MRKPTALAMIATLVLSASSSMFVLAASAKTKAPNTEDPSLKNFDIGKEFVDKKDWDGAIDAFLQSIYFARNNYQPQANYWLAVSYEAKHEDLKAIDAAKKYLEQNLKDSADGHLLLAELYLRNRRDDECVDECNKVISSTPLSPTGSIGADAVHAHWIYGRVFERQEKYGMAQMEYLNALGQQPWSYTPAWMSYSEMFMKEKQYVQALEQFQAMLKSEVKLKGLNPCRIYCDMGICLLTKGDHEGALKDWHIALDFDKADAETHLNLAMMFDAETHLSAALTEYRQFVRYSNEQYKVAKAKERIQRLEQKLTPAEPEYVPKPSPYMRQQQQQAQGTETELPAPSKDAGF